MSRPKVTTLNIGSATNIGSAASPVDFGSGILGYKRKGRWHYRNTETERRFGRKFIEASDAELALELEKRGYKTLCPAHECVDRPDLPCPACEMFAIKSLRHTLKICG